VLAVAIRLPQNERATFGGTVGDWATPTPAGGGFKQMGIALHGYHGVQLSLPPAMHTIADAHQYWSWMAFILPHMEEESLWNAADQYARTVNSYVWGGNPAEGTYMKCYVCPMDPRGSVQLMLANGSSLGVTGPIAFTEYLGNSGTMSGANDGPFYVNSSIRLTDITDGTESTLMVGERPPSVDLDFGWWFAGYGYNGTAIGDNCMAARDPNYPASLAGWNTVSTSGAPCPTTNIGFLPGLVDNPCDQTHYWSFHPGGANFLFCDGSVHFMNYDFNNVLPQASTRAGQEVFTMP
jgi:prepilin-type processing-associated H-X9-DG protein